tara:strand:+ start:1925 stop:2482 length:558 start_codon:yes stop_codon:yes gene_type:complete
MSAADLAEKTGTSQPQITRLERGERRLTVDWMQRLAKALGCQPSDLFNAATLAEFNEEATPYVQEGPFAATARALASKGLAYYTIASDSVEQLGIAPGTIVLIDMTQAAVDAVKTGDVVIAQLYNADPNVLQARTVVRQFIAPNLLVTNRVSNNMVVTMVNDMFEAHIKGVVVPDAADLEEDSNR